MNEPAQTLAPAPAPTPPSWRNFLAQYAVPTAVASIVATVLSVYTAIGAAQEKQREYNTKFEQLVSSPEIWSAFGGAYVDVSSKNAAHELQKEAFKQSVREQQATATLLALQSVADSETQRRTVLLIGARLLNADPNFTGTGGPAARLLTVLIDQVRNGLNSWNPAERHLNERLWETINAQSFKDLITAGYSSDYYNDDMTNEKLRVYWPTLNGDAPITTDPKFELLWSVTPRHYEGWVNLATFGYRLATQARVRNSLPGDRGVTQPIVSRKVAEDFLAEATDVILRHNATRIGAITSQYAIADPRIVPPIDPRFDVRRLINPSSFPNKLIMLRHRLLRSRPPVEYINPDGTFRKGSLGRIVGAVPAGSCVTVVEPFQPVLVFLPLSVITPSMAQQPHGTETLGGLVHMWAHVRGSADDADCLSVVGKIAA